MAYWPGIIYENEVDMARQERTPEPESVGDILSATGMEDIVNYSMAERVHERIMTPEEIAVYGLALAEDYLGHPLFNPVEADGNLNELLNRYRPQE